MTLNLPQKLADNLTLRWATIEDSDKLAKFNGRIHGSSPDESDRLDVWTRDLMNGRHPTTSASDFLLVENEAGDVVSSTCHISQRWAYDGIEFNVGRPELVGTDENYRRRGLVAKQFEIVHALSEQRNELMQAITGIPWYYRQFGYEMGLDLGGNRHYTFPVPPKKKVEETKKEDQEKKESYSWRDVTPDDIPLLTQLYQNHCMNSLVYTIRDKTQWHYELTENNPKSINDRTWRIIEDEEGDAVAYLKFAIWGSNIFVQELGTRADCSLRAIGLSILTLAAAHAQETEPSHEVYIRGLYFAFSAHHAIYDALDPELQAAAKPYAWYIRIPDLPRFLHHITPVLESRLADSVMAGHTGKLRLNFYKKSLQLTFERGRITEIEPYKMAHDRDTDANFPDLQFIQLLCGRRDIDELQHIHADCFANNGAKVLLKIIFPKRASQPVGIG